MKFQSADRRLQIELQIQICNLKSAICNFMCHCLSSTTSASMTSPCAPPGLEPRPADPAPPPGPPAPAPPPLACPPPDAPAPPPAPAPAGDACWYRFAAALCCASV